MKKATRPCGEKIQKKGLGLDVHQTGHWNCNRDKFKLTKSIEQRLWKVWKAYSENFV